MRKLFSSERGFGLLLSIILFALSIYSFGYQLSILIYASVLSLLISIIFPKVFKMPNKLWIGFGIFLGKILNPLICFILYFLVVGTTKIILDIFRVKLINKTKRKK